MLYTIRVRSRTVILLYLGLLSQMHVDHHLLLAIFDTYRHFFLLYAIYIELNIVDVSIKGHHLLNVWNLLES